MPKARAEQHRREENIMHGIGVRIFDDHITVGRA